MPLAVGIEEDDVRPQAAMRALRRALAAVTTAYALQDVLCTILDACAGWLGHPYCALLLLDARHDELAGHLIFGREFQAWLRDHARAPHHPSLIILPRDARQNLIARVVSDARAYSSNQLYDLVRPLLPPKRAAAVQRKCRITSVTALPLLTRKPCSGVFVVASSPLGIADPDLSTCGLFATVAALAIKNADLVQGLRARERQVNALRKALLAAQPAAEGRLAVEREVDRAGLQSGCERLTQRELEVLRLLVTGRRNAEIAEALTVSLKTVEFHVGHVLHKLGARSRAEAIRNALQQGIMRLDDQL